ncbi:MAG: hypothetical protein V7767_02170 [Leeuwenhoekiella sp.]
MEDNILQILIAVGPAIVVGVLAYYFFNRFIENEDGRRRFLLHKDMQADVLPLRLQAYERLTLFLERISPSQLLIRVPPSGTDKALYEKLLLANIEQEFEHNLAQQIYMSDELWNIIKSAKNGTIRLVRNASANENVTNADQLREIVLKEILDKAAPTAIALEYLKKEVKQLFG